MVALRIFGAFIVLTLLGVVGFSVYSTFVDPGYSGKFDPGFNPDQIVTVNSRTARPSGCTPKAKSVNWPSIMGPDSKGRFAKRVQELGATAGTSGMLEIDRELVGLSIQIAIDDKAIERGVADDLKRSAEQQLFKPNARSFVLMHNYDEPLVMEGEPTLLAERKSPGRLVGMSMAAGRGFPPHGIGLLIFEDRVCKDDLSFTVKFPDLSKRYSFFGRVANEFVFGGESIQILNVIAASYSRYVPSPAVSPTTTQARLAMGDLIALGQLAVDIVKLMSSL